MVGGKEANESGKWWEDAISTSARRQGFDLKNYKLRANYPLPLAERRVIWTHAPYKTVFHHTKQQAAGKTSTEFVIECAEQLVRIECKWQKGSGSVDEKYLFALLNAGLTIEEPTVALALGGAYFENGRGRDVREWLRMACKNPPEWLSVAAKEKWRGKELLILTPNDIGEWFRKRFPVS